MNSIPSGEQAKNKLHIARRRTKNNHAYKNSHGNKMKRIELLDYGRFMAAISVVAYHYLCNGINNGKISSITSIPEVLDIAKYGYLGVPFFFMISGYVIFFSAQARRAGEFAASRALRLFPAYWTAVVLTSLFALFWGGEKMAVTFPQLMANLTMLPSQFGYGFVDGVYWTLELELKFYAAVLVLMLLGLSGKLEKILLFWPFLILPVELTGRDYIPIFGGYYCFFAAGSVLAIFKTRRTIFSATSLCLSLWLCVEFTVKRAGSLTQSHGQEFSGIIIGSTVICFFLFFLLVNTEKGSSISLPGSKLLGALTYPLYLVHAHIGYMLISRFASEQNKVAVTAITVAFVLSASYLIHMAIERECAKFWKSLFHATIGRVVECTHVKSEEFQLWLKSQFVRM